jgi:pimeloyl-ACP methyl ester carboxylesterase
MNMEKFEIPLPDGGIISGRFNFPAANKTPANPPLIVCVPGGSYDAEYFDVDEDYSITSTSAWAGIPTIALTRPGYGSSTPAPMDDTDQDTTYGQFQGKYLNSTVLPALWRLFSERTGTTAIVLLSHSIGAMISTIVAGSYTGTEGYPLAGLITSGIGAELAEGPRGGMLHVLDETTGLISFEATPKDAIMLQIPMQNLTDREMCRHTDRLNHPVPPGELHDINQTWLGYWRKYSDRVAVPVMHGLSEFDGLWNYSPKILEEYKAAFSASPKVTSEMIPLAPHCIELSLQSKSWYMKCCAFALECVNWYELRPKSRPVSVKSGILKEGTEDTPGQSGIATLVYSTTRYEEGGL